VYEFGDVAALVDRELAQWSQLAVGGDAPHALVLHEEHGAVTQQQEVLPRQPHRVREVPALLVPGEPAYGQKEGRWVARRGVGRALDGEGSKRGRDDVRLVKDDVRDTQVHRDSEGLSGRR